MNRALLPSAAALLLAPLALAFQETPPSSSSSSETKSSIADAPLATWQVELLELAFQSASAMPVKPHLKSRSRAQDEVVAACFALGQPRRALAYAEKIGNWRRGAGYAAYALWCAEHGDAHEAERALDLADRVCHEEKGEDFQEWRVERIRAAIARAFLAMGRTEKAATYEAGLPASETAELEIAHAAAVDAAAFDDKLAAVDRVVAVGDFDSLRNALQACAELFDRFYGDRERRDRVATKIQASWQKLPSPIRLELMATMIESSLAHADEPAALARVEESAAMLKQTRLSPDHAIPWMARLAALRFRAGDEAGARAEAAAAMKSFDAGRVSIVDIDRADVLRPLAEALQAMGDRAGALRVYAMTVEAGVENRNSRPRADDLVATCCSLARHGCEPDAALKARLLEVAAGLADPW